MKRLIVALLFVAVLATAARAWGLWRPLFHPQLPAYTPVVRTETQPTDNSSPQRFRGVIRDYRDGCLFMDDGVALQVTSVAGAAIPLDRYVVIICQQTVGGKLRVIRIREGR